MGFCEDSNEPKGSIQGMWFLD